MREDLGVRLLMLGYEFPSSTGEAVVSGEVKNPASLAWALAARGHSVTVASVPFLTRTQVTSDLRATPGPLPVHDIPEGRGRGVLRYLDRAYRVSRWLRRQDPRDFDVVHAQAPPLALAVRLAGRRWADVPLVVTGHGTNLPEADADAHGGLRHRLRALHARAVVPVDRAGFSAADMTISVSGFQAQELQEIYRVPSDRIRVIRNGVDFDRYAPDEERRRDSGSADILFVGRMAPKKGLVPLVRAMPRVLEAVPEARLHIVGGSEPFNFLGDAVADEIRALGLSGHVQVEMAVPESELPGYYRSHDVLIAPSEGYESLPTVILEAIACRTPVIATKSWGTPEVLGDDHPGLLESTEPADIAEALVRFLTDPRVREQALEAQGRRVELFDLRTCLTDHVSLYEEVSAP